MKKPILATWFLIFFSPIFAILMFKNIAEARIAGLLAGSVFLCSAIFIAAVFFQVFRFKSFVVYTAFLHTILFSLPIFLTRMIHWQQDFQSLSIAGIPLTQMHKMSEVFYMFFALSLAVDSLRYHFWFKKMQEAQGQAKF